MGVRAARHYVKAAVPVCVLITLVVACLAVSQLMSPSAPSEGNLRSQDGPAGLQQLEAQPEYSAPTTTDPRLSALVNRESGVPRVTGDISTSIAKLDNPRDIAAVSLVLADTKDDDTARNEAANLLRRSDYPQLTDELMTVLDNPEEQERFRTFCVQHLYNNHKRAGPAEKDQIVSKLRECLTDRHVKVRREALLALHRLKDEGAEALARKWLREEGETGDGVRDLAIRIIRERNLRDELPSIRKLASDKNTIIRIAALVTLSEWRDEESRPLMEEAGKSENVRLQRCGKLALKRLEEPPPAPRPEKRDPAVETPAKQPVKKEVEGF